MPRISGLALIAVCAGACACASLSPAYLPLESHKRSTENVDAEITRVRASQFLQVLHPTLQLTARTPVTVETVRLADGEAAPCTRGLQAAMPQPWRLDSAQSSALELTFSGPDLGPGGRLAREAAVVDLTLAAPGLASVASGCMRLPLVNTTAHDEWEHQPFGWSLGLGVRLLRPTATIGDLVGGWGGVLPIRVGHWFGAVRLGSELLVGRLGSPDSSPDRHVNLLGIAGVAGVTLARGPRSAVSLDAAYEVFDARPGPRPTNDPAPRMLLHGPRAALRLDILAPANELPGFRGQPPRTSLSFEPFVSTWWADRTWSRAFLFGVGLSAGIF
jgi:hypothetical protein